VLSINAEPIPLREDAGGTVRVAGTRITLDTIVESFKGGDGPAEILEGFPDLTLADVYAVLTYYLRHQAEVERYLHDREVAAFEARTTIEAGQGDQRGLRERLLTRRALHHLAG